MLYQILKNNLTDKRRKQAQQHDLATIIYVSIIAMLCGAVDMKQISIWMKKNMKRKEIKKLLGVDFVKPPSKSTVSLIFKELNADELEKVFRGWTKLQLKDKVKLTHIATDGKVMRGSSHKDKKAIEVLSLLLADIGIVIAHKQIANKSNEIPAFQEMLKELDDSYIFTFDAMHTQKKL